MMCLVTSGRLDEKLQTMWTDDDIICEAQVTGLVTCLIYFATFLSPAPCYS